MVKESWNYRTSLAHYNSNTKICVERKNIHNMDKNEIIETAFETIKESTEWGLENEGKTYGHWIDGVVTVVDNILKRISEEKSGRSVAEN